MSTKLFPASCMVGKACIDIAIHDKDDEVPVARKMKLAPFFPQHLARVDVGGGEEED